MLRDDKLSKSLEVLLPSSKRFAVSVSVAGSSACRSFRPNSNHVSVFYGSLKASEVTSHKVSSTLRAEEARESKHH